MNITALCRQLGITRSAYYCRVRRGWSPDQIVTQVRYQHRPRPATGQARSINQVLREWRR